ncbi:MAG TPA: zinc ribbon domain-containing protein [Ktedonobacteraceae bacterium]
MIRCSHCGKLAPAGALSCQNCGMPLASGGMASAGPAEQQELPAWLESLRAHERPPASGQGDRQPFSMDELVDENSMPHWMRRNQPGVSESGNSDAFPALPTHGQPGVDPQEQAPAASGLIAGSLIDEQSLPSWMRNSREEAQPIAGQSFSAHSLVDQQSLPPWIKELGQSGQMPAASSSLAEHGLPTQFPVTPPSLSRVAPVPQTPPVQESAPHQGFAAHDLIDQRELPAWMQGIQESGPQGRPVPTQSGFSAGELIDQRSLPGWMQEQPGQEQTGPIPARGVPVNGSGQGMNMGQGSTEGMPAATFIDMDSLPPWMREGEQGNAAAQGRMAAGSLIDQSSLPQWMRNVENERAAMTGASLTGTPGHTRNEGMRVPGRPRAEAGPQEQSEVAANVFSSMLGVAASAPVIPGQAPASNLGVAQGQPVPPPPAPPPPVLPGWQSPAPSPAERNAQPQAWRSSGQVPASAPYPYAPNSLAGMQPQAGRGEQLPTGFAPTGRTGNTLAPGMGSNSSGRAPANDTKKKGFFDAIREFFFK